MRDPLALAQRILRPAQPIPRVVNATSPAYRIGDRAGFWVSDGTQATPVHFILTATLRYVTPHVYIWVQDDYLFDQATLARSAERFETQTYPTNRRYFGSEPLPGVDNDPHLSILNGHVPGVVGYFYSPNEYSRLVNPFSNEREIFFINLDSAKFGSTAYDAVLAHEFQHMIHWNNDRNEEAWVSEGMSKLAETLNGFSVSGPIESFLRRPDTQLTTWALHGEDSGPHYGASYLFMAYFLQRFGEPALATVSQSALNGGAGFDVALRAAGRSERFDDVFADWVVANYLNDAALAGGRYGYRDVKLSRPTVMATHAQYPVEGAGDVRQYGADYIVLNGNAARGLSVEVEGQAETRLAEMTPPAGRWTWWSNRGDQTDCSLTHAFDLRNVGQATLTYRLWYDIEEDWDYAFVLASTDDGQSWDLLETPAMSRSNPNGNSLGPAYTGVSGAGDAPAWLEERIDLSRYAGRRILLRFEQITDDAVNHVGLFLDDVRIPEIGFQDDMEAGEGAWQAAGFVRTDNRLPQRYLAQVIEYAGGTPTVRRMTLDATQRGQITLEPLTGGVAVLIVSALAPATTQSAPYRYRISVAP